MQIRCHFSKAPAFQLFPLQAILLVSFMNATTAIAEAIKGGSSALKDLVKTTKNLDSSIIVYHAIQSDQIKNPLTLF